MREYAPSRCILVAGVPSMSLKDVSGFCARAVAFARRGVAPNTYVILLLGASCDDRRGLFALSVERWGRENNVPVHRPITMGTRAARIRDHGLVNVHATHVAPAGPQHRFDELHAIERRYGRPVFSETAHAYESGEDIVLSLSLSDDDDDE
jgi:hypothetical protein